MGLPTDKSLKIFTSEVNWDYSEKTINNLSWIIMHQAEGPGDGTYHNYVSSKNVLVDLSVVSGLYKSDELYQILSTFKFTENKANNQTDSGPLKTILNSINTQLNTNYQEYTQDNGLKWNVDLTKSNNKSDILVIQKAIKTFGLVYQPDISNGAGSDWQEIYARNADTCSLGSINNQLILSCYN